MRKIASSLKLEDQILLPILPLLEGFRIHQLLHLMEKWMQL